MLRDVLAEHIPHEEEARLIRALVDDIAAPRRTLDSLAQFASQHSSPSDPATLGRGLLGTAMFLYAAGAGSAAVDHIVAAARLSSKQRVRGLGLCLGIAGVLVVAHELSSLDPRVARLASAAETSHVRAMESAAPPRLDWMVGVPGLVHAFSLVDRPEQVAPLRASLWRSVDSHLEAFETTLPAEFSPLAHAHGVAGAIAALATRCPSAQQGRLASVAWRLLGVVRRMPSPDLAWIAASWCGGHVGIASSLRRASTASGDEQLLSEGWNLFRAALEDGKHQNEPHSVCHGLGGTTAVAASFARALRTPEATQLHASLRHRLLSECAADRGLNVPRNYELVTGMTGTLAAAGSPAGFARILEAGFAI